MIQTKCKCGKWMTHKYPLPEYAGQIPCDECLEDSLERKEDGTAEQNPAIT